MKLFKFWPVLIFLFLTLIFFWKFFLRGLLPVPSDTIVGMYHPWREVVWDGLSSGVPFKNFLITDPVRQQIPWRKLVIDYFLKGQWPSWNPYTMTGMPLAANLQSAPLYIFNFLFLIFNFSFAWGILIWLQPFLAGIFMYLFLWQKKLGRPASFLGAVIFAFSGFFIAWLEWGTVLHSALWLPLIILSIDKIFTFSKKAKFSKWFFIFVFALCQSFFAGHLQIFFYVFLFSFIYLITQIILKKKKKVTFLFLIFYFLFFIFSMPQWRPTWKLIQQSARQVDQADWTKPGWFMPWQHLAQFLAPDFFGNPTTLNYWGEWNYGELMGFVGVIPLFLALWAVVKKHAKLFMAFGLMALSFALPTPWAKLIYQWQVPFLSTSQPTRLLFLVDFCLAILAAYGFKEFIKKPSLKIIWPAIFYLGLWLFVLINDNPSLVVAKRNLVLPTALVVAFLVLSAMAKVKLLILPTLMLLTIFDLFRFGWKFEPFVKKAWLFPATQTIDFLQQDKDIFRVMAADDRVMPPNFAAWYGLQDIAGYDPLYLQRYGELAAAMERNEPNIDPPLGFNRIVTPKNWSSPLTNLLNVKYILSLSNLNSPDLELVFQEGETRVYRNKKVFPRAFLVYDYQVADDKQKAIELMMQVELDKTVVLEQLPAGVGMDPVPARTGNGAVEIFSYQPNRVEITVKTILPGILVLSDAFYPGWQAQIDGQATNIYQANYHFRAVAVPEGKHKVVLQYSL